MLICVAPTLRNSATISKSSVAEFLTFTTPEMVYSQVPDVAETDVAAVFSCPLEVDIWNSKLEPFELKLWLREALIS